MAHTPGHPPQGGAAGMVAQGPTANGPANEVMPTGPQTHIGVPNGWTVTKPGAPQRLPELEGYMGPVGPSGLQPQTVQPRYAVNDEYNTLKGMSPAEIAELQRELARLGLLKGTYRLGTWQAGDATVAAVATLLGTANQLGTDIKGAVAHLEANPEVGADPTAASTLQYQLPDRDEIISTVNDSARTLLGRKLDQATLDRIANSYEAELRAIQEQNHVNRLVEGATLRQAPSLDAYAEQRLEQENPGEVGAQRFANIMNGEGGLLQTVFGSATGGVTQLG